MASDIDNRINDLFRTTDRLVDSLSAMQVFASRPTAAVELPELLSETAARDVQEEQLKIAREQLAEQRRTNEHLQTLADKQRDDTLGP